MHGFYMYNTILPGVIYPLSDECKMVLDPNTSIFVVKVLSIVVIRPTCLAVIQRGEMKTPTLASGGMDESSGSTIGDYTPSPLANTDEIATYRYSFTRPIAKGCL